MRQVEFPEIKLSFNVPENLAECSTKEYLAISYLAMQYLGATINFEEFKIHAITTLMNMKVSKKFKDNEDVNANIYYLSQLIDGYFYEKVDEKDKKKKKLLDLNFLQIKIPFVKTTYKKYHAPTNTLFELTYGEFADASRVFEDFHASGDVFNLYLLASILYRQRSPFTKKIKPYKAAAIEKQAKHFQKYVSLSFVYGVYLQFLAFKQYIPVAKIPWSGQTLNFEILFEGDADDTEKTIPGIGVDSMVFSLAESGVFGSTENVRTANFLEIMIHLYDLRRRDLDRQKQEKADANNK